MEQTDLYIKIKRYITKYIYKGVYQEGDRIPSERALSEELGVSRVTIRKSLHELEKEQLLEREVGRGTKIRFKNTGHQEELKMICLVAPAKKSFFSRFIEAFQKVLDDQDILLVYLQKPKNKSLEDCIFGLYERGLHNVVVWPDDESLDEEKLKRLRAIGMNLTFFDIDMQCEYGDSILMDNTAAIRELIKLSKKNEKQEFTYIGWDNYDMYSVQRREALYRKYQKSTIHVETISWKNQDNVNDMVAEIIDRMPDKSGVICGDGDIGFAVGQVLAERRVKEIDILSIDDFAQSGIYPVITIGQDYKSAATAVYNSIKDQCTNSDKWMAKTILIKGEKIIRK